MNPHWEFAEMTQAGLSRPASLQTLLLELATVTVVYALENGSRHGKRHVYLFIYLFTYLCMYVFIYYGL